MRIRSWALLLALVAVAPRLAAQQSYRKEVRVLPWGEVLDLGPNGGWRSKARQVAQSRQRMMSRGAIDQLNAPIRAGAAVVASPSALSGTLHVPVILFRFSDHGTGSVFDTSQYNSALFGDVPPAGRPYTVKSYYTEVSNGLITIHGSAYGWFTLPQAEVNYTGPAGGCPQNPANASHNCNGIWSQAAFGQLRSGLTLALQQADQVVDFSQYDNDGPDGIPNSGDDDGVVDLVIFMQSEEDGACDESTNNHPWSHESSGLGFVTNDARHGGGFITVNSYTMQSGVGGSTACSTNQITAVGTAAHETGHAFGLPDLYDTQSNAEGIGEWGIMGSGNYTSPLSPAHHDAWSKQQLGWVTLTVLSTSGTYAIDPVVTSHSVYYIRPTGANPRGEYLLLENKQALGSDTANMLTGEGGSGTPGKLGGLLIWHIDSAQVADHGFGGGNAVNSGPIQGVRLTQADGLAQLQLMSGGNRGDRGDPYPGSTNNTLFGANSNPAAVKNFDGSYLGFQIDSIKQVVPNGQMSFHVGFGGLAVVRATNLNAQVSVDGVKYSRFAQVLTAGSQHTIAIDSLQAPDGLTQYVFNAWSDGGAQTHTFTAQQNGDSISASLLINYLLQVTPVGTGTLTSPSFAAPALAAGLFVRKDSLVTLIATPPAHGVVDTWTGDTVASGDTLKLAMTRPFTVNVKFLLPTLDVVVVTQQITGLGSGLSSSDQRYLDLLGNKNGKFDLGDFLAWVRETGATPPSARRVATMRTLTVPALSDRKVEQ